LPSGCRFRIRTGIVTHELPLEGSNLDYLIQSGGAGRRDAAREAGTDVAVTGSDCGENVPARDRYRGLVYLIQSL
jgi:hypothetical protein